MLGPCDSACGWASSTRRRSRSTSTASSRRSTPRRPWPRTCRRRDRAPGSASCAAGHHGVRRILIVDDEPSVRDVMATVLVDAGYSVLTAADGHIALVIIDDASPNLIITDVMMPHLDGWALLDHARERDPALPVILMSAGDWIRRRRTT